ADPTGREDPLAAAPLTAAMPPPAGLQNWKELADFQELVAQVTQRAVLSDYYHDKKVPTFASVANARSVGNLLEALAQPPLHYRWWSSGGAILFRNRRWFLDDLAEVPATLARIIREVRETAA